MCRNAKGRFFVSIDLPSRRRFEICNLDEKKTFYYYPFTVDILYT